MISIPLRKTTVPKLLNSKGQPVVLNEAEIYHAQYMQRMVNERFYPQLKNSLGYEINITTLSTISKQISEQKFFEIPPADYVPIRVGDATWSSNIVHYRSFDIADGFETGILNLGGNNTRQANADAGVDSLTIKIYNWSKSIGWNIFELQEAAKSGNWDLVAAKERSRKRNWDLGVQKIAFLGLPGQNGLNGNCLGLLNQPGITNNATVITQPISAMNTAALKAFTVAVVEAYRSNNNRTAWPTHFVLPESDYNGLASQASPDFPIKSTLQLLEETFMTICRNKNFKILPLAYADRLYSGFAYQIYTLLNYDEESLRMDVPLDYTNTLANSLDNFNFQNAGYGQVTGVLALRPLELLYFTY